MESRSADQNHILIAVVAKELHGDDILGAGRVHHTQIHLPTPVSQHSEETDGEVRR